MTGRLILAGIDPYRLPAGDLLDVAYTLMVDGIAAGVNVEEVMQRLDEILDEPLGASPTSPDRAAWGTGTRAAEGQRAMMALAGPPPVMPRREVPRVDDHR